MLELIFWYVIGLVGAFGCVTAYNFSETSQWTRGKVVIMIIAAITGPLSILYAIIFWFFVIFVLGYDVSHTHKIYIAANRVIKWWNTRL